MRSSKPIAWALAACLIAVAGCDRGAHDRPLRADSPAIATPPPVTAPAVPKPTLPVRDLSIDESMGGHTLARHVGRTDADLRERLRREPQISSASTYTDRATAERVIAGALSSSSGRVKTWEAREGRRNNLVLNYSDRAGPPLGRSLSRGQQTSVPCSRALVVLRWDDRADRFYVLTSYPEAGR